MSTEYVDFGYWDLGYAVGDLPYADSPITFAQQAELEKANTRVAYFAEFHFSGGTVRFCTFNQTINWNGYDWTGVGGLGSISQVTESDSLEAKSLTFSLNIADPQIIALAVGPVEAYRGREARMYHCPLDESYQPVDAPVLCWLGQMDMMSLGIQGENGNISLKCETAAYGLKRRPALRVNAAQHKQKYPTDTGLDFLTDLIANPTLWLSKKFQQA
jgi:hypothetical protein